MLKDALAPSVFPVVLRSPVRCGMVNLKPGTLQAFDDYVRAAEARLDQQVNGPWLP